MRDLGRWHDAEELRRELERFCAGRVTFPTSREFNAARRSDLRRAVGDFGGSAYWAHELGLRVIKDRSPYELVDAVSDARQVIAEQGGLPNAKRLVKLGYPRLAQVVRRAGGAAAFADAHLREHD